MQFLIVLGLVACSFAAPQGYSAPAAPFPSFQHSRGFSSGQSSFVGGSQSSFVGGGHGGSCGSGQVRHVDGRCVTPMVSRNVYLYEAPHQQRHVGPPPSVPQPRVDYNIVFVRTPEFLKSQGPVVVPPPQQKTIVYVLNKNAQIEGQRVIEVPHTPEQPEVYYVNYNDGDNPTLPGGIDLQTALQTTGSQQAQVIGGSAGAVSGGSGDFGGSFAAPSGQYGVP